MSTQKDFTKAVHYAVPVNGWEVSHPDGSVPVFISEALDRLCASWTYDGEQFALVSKENDHVIWKRGESIAIADGECIIKHLPTKTMWGFDLFDEGGL